MNVHKRAARADLRGRVAVITGGRIKIGYAMSLRLLRDGAAVIVTTRFPQDALKRYAAEPDAECWLSRLTLYGLDLRDVRAVEAFCHSLIHTLPHLDILINNAAQTIARPAPFYAHLFEGERLALPDSGPQTPQIAQAAPLLPIDNDSAAALASYFPPGQLDEFGEQLDLRPDNSWTQRLEQIGGREWLEVQLINVTAPSLLCRELLPLLLRSPFARRFIVNVSAIEGVFERRRRNDRHPHTNMAKAALNMLTATSAPGLARSSIFMTSVDTGWVSQQEPQEQRDRMKARGFTLPLETEDAVARVYDPVVQGLTRSETPPFGVYLKDFRVHPW
ncbi:SDR family NAD(P)-dependent oxidoreductase [Deinococcus sp.]|uniref:SDR family NAD(P)-dependent oxidoreductase n=1 Tax=Deinococcus sp. TaxID=47478 RepID=UPI003C7AB8A2